MGQNVKLQTSLQITRTAATAQLEKYKYHCDGMGDVAAHAFERL